MNNFQKLVDINAASLQLWLPVGHRCRTSESIKPYLIEETYEVIEAIDEKSPVKMKEELGDLLLQVVPHAQIAKGPRRIRHHDVIDRYDKMVSRHPHVFATPSSRPEEVTKAVARQKEEEGKLKDSALRSA